MLSPQHLLIIDGSCGFCVACSVALKRIVPECTVLELQAITEFDMTHLGLTHLDLMSAVHVVVGGCVYSGYDALVELLAPHIRVSVLAAIIRSEYCRMLGRAAYKLIAKNRSRISAMLGTAKYARY